MHVTRELPDQTEVRLRRIAAEASVEMLPGLWQYEEFGVDQFPALARHEALALVRGSHGWSQLVPSGHGGPPGKPLRLWRIHFPASADNSGFVGWLASHIKKTTGSGVIVICGHDAARGGVFDYWGCPAEAAPTVLAEIRRLITPAPSRPREASPFSLNGVRMRAVATAGAGEVNAATLFTFSQMGDTVWACYDGGPVVVGYLVGTLTPGRLVFRYAQVDDKGVVDGGRSECDVHTLPDGRIRIVERFQWESREGSGTNVLEQTAD